MCAQFVTIGNVFAERNLTVPVLRCLEPDGAFYETLAIQPRGNIAAAPGVLGHADQPAAHEKFNAFVALAGESGCDVAACPEYSMPWPVLSGAITGGTLPHTGKIWVFGCEAISRDDLTAFIAQHPTVEWIHEPIPNTSGTFLGVVVYLIQTTTTGNSAKTVGVVQFKTSPMGGDDFERDNLICGTRIYIWHNPIQVVRLFTLICSDALNWNPHTAAECNFALYPYLILHLQLNPAPRHPGFIYRGTLFSINQNISENFEVVSLNWARGFAVPGRPPSANGCSTIYTKSPQYNLTDDRLVANHRLGLYFANWQAQRVQLGIFNFDEHVFRFRNLKVRQFVGGAQAARTGPEMLHLYQWDAGSHDWHSTAAGDDGFNAYSQELGAANYYSDAAYSPLARERLFLLCSGKVSKLTHSDGWQHPRHLESVEAEPDERSKRLTFTHETTGPSPAYRNEVLGRFLRLQHNILTNPANFPPAIEDLSGDVRLEPPSAANGFRRNLVSLSGAQKAPAVGVFLGNVSPAEALNLRNAIVSAWSTEDKPLYRIAVWYERLGNLERTPDGPPPTCDGGPDDPTSIYRGSPS